MPVKPVGFSSGVLVCDSKMADIFTKGGDNEARSDE